MWNMFKKSEIYWISCIVIGLLAGVFYRLYIINPYPPRFYLPGLLSKSLHPTSRNSDEIKWIIPDLKADCKTLKNIHSNTNNKPYNIILIIADDLGSNDLSGGAGVATPNIDSLAKEGVKFSKAYSGHATCAPSRAAIMTGRFGTRFGFEFTPVPKELAIALAKYENHSLRHPLLYRDEFSNTPPMVSMTVPLDEEFIAQKLQKYDYNSYYLGKWHLGEINGSRPMEKGYTDSLTFLHGASLYLPNDHINVINAPVGGALDDFLRFNLDFSISHSNGHNFQPSEYMTDYLTSETVNLIRNLRSTSEIECEDYQQPFFITLAYNAPHNPLQALESDYNSPELANITSHIARVYAAMIKALDRGVGRVIEAVHDINETDNTMIIFTSDNGGAHYLGLNNINHPYRGWKATLFEGGLRVPFYIKLPKLISPGLIVDTPVGHVDIFNTILAVASYNYISNDDTNTNINNMKMDGKNLLPYIMNIDDNAHIFNELVNDSSQAKSISTSEIHESLYWRSGHYKSILHHGWKLQISSRPKKMWLFHLSVDPYEKNNLIGSHEIEESSNVNRSDIEYNFNELYRLLMDIDKEQAEPLWPALIEVPISIDKTDKVQENENDEYVYWAN